MTDRSRNVEDALPPGTRIEEFVIERALQSGGFGMTYLAQDRSLGRRVAIKEYLPREWGGRRADGTVGPRSASHAEDYRWGLARFLEEARTLARLDHPRIVRVHRVIEAWGTAYMVMEYVEGRNLEETLKAEGPWPEERVRGLLDSLLPGVAQVHAAGLIHRDVKPANVMLRGDGTPVLIDFGAARYAAGVHSRSLTSVLTPGYAPHEQYQTSGKQGAWTDVYALGAVAYRALSGRAPAEAAERVSAIAQRQADPLAPVSQAAGGVSESFGAAVTSALALFSEGRPQDVSAWRAQWDAGAVPAPSPAQAVPSPPQVAGAALPASDEVRVAPRKARRPGLLLAGLAALVLAAGVAIGLIIDQRPDAAPPGGGVPPPVPPDPAEVEEALGLDRATWRLVQLGLAHAEFDPGPTDGDPGPGTRTALERWQQARGTGMTGYLDAESMRELRAAGRRAEAEEEDRRRAEAEAAAEVARRAAAEAERRRLAELRRPGRVFRDCDTCPRMVVIPAGTFTMGSPASEVGRFDSEGPRHAVTLRSFAMGVTEVTFDEWDACARGGGCDGYRPSDEGWGRGSRPVINVSWEDAQAYVEWLSESAGAAYRLPSESEWEYAARAGTTTPFHTGPTISTDEVNYGSFLMRTTPAGTFAKNRFGLYDVHGNVLEWVEDCWHGDYGGAPPDGMAWTRGGDCFRRVLRGGSWNLNPRRLRSANRDRFPTGVRVVYAGFRVSRTLD